MATDDNHDHDDDDDDYGDDYDDDDPQDGKLHKLDIHIACYLQS